MRPPFAVALVAIAVLLSVPGLARAQSRLDTDGDAVLDSTDNCRDVRNADQRDTNRDGFGNACDPDIDDNDSVNRRDFLLLQSFVGKGKNAHADLDGDGQVDAADMKILQAYLGKPPGPGVDFLPQGTFYLHEGSFVPRFTDADAIVIEGNAVRTLSGCPPTEARFFTGSRATKIEVKWEKCPGADEPTYAMFRVDKLSRATLTGVFKIPGLIPQDVVATPNTGAGLRFATYNAQFLPSTFSAGTTEENGERMVERIKASGYDFIVLNEMFDEDLKEVVRSGLAGTYPYYVEYLDAADLEDSALQLYSKFPFDPLPNPQFVIPPLECRASGATVTIPNPDPGGTPPTISYDKDCERIAFLEFDSCDDDDCFASKGVGLVRLRHPVSGQSINVLFTHMQASYIPATHPDEQADIDDALDWYNTRRDQLEDAEKLITETIGTTGIQNEQIFFLGDFNIDGDLADPDYGNNYTVYSIENLHEWAMRFANPGTFFTDVLRDGWAYDNAPFESNGNYDRGLTNVTAWGANSEGARLDYILHKVDERTCAQHMTLARNLNYGAPYIETGMGPAGIGQGGVDELSDHIGVNMDWNLRRPYCSPATALDVDPTPGALEGVTGQIDLPGMMKWYRFDEKGTYSFQLLSPGGADFRVYEAIDLTTPVVNYKEETTTIDFKRLTFVGKQFRISSAPFYVRVFHPDRTASKVDFDLLIVKHDCLTPETACALKPGETLAHELPANPTGGLGDEAWFELYTEGTPDDLEQKLHFFANGIALGAADGGFKMELVREDASSVIDSDAALEQVNSQYVLAIDASEKLKEKRYLAVKRAPPMPQPYPPQYNHFRVGWTTDLTIFFGSAQGGQSIQMRCLEENDGADLDGDDELYLSFASVAGSNVANHAFIGDFDAGNKAPMDGLINAPIYYTTANPLVVHFYEDDDFIAGDNDEYEREIKALDPDTEGPLERNFEFAPGGSGLYQFRYNLTHGFDE